LTIYQILWCTQWSTWSYHAHRCCKDLNYCDIYLQIDDGQCAGMRNVCYHSYWFRWPFTRSHDVQIEAPGATTPTHAVWDWTLAYNIRTGWFYQCIQTICERGSSRWSILCITGCSRWPPGPFWVIADVPYTYWTHIIDLQANFTKLHSHTASVGVVAPGDPFRTS
jgi:hypothetical protein